MSGLQSIVLGDRARDVSPDNAGMRPPWNVDKRQTDDAPEVARLLVRLYEEEAPSLVPSDVESFTALLETGLRDQDLPTADTTLVARDSTDETRLAGYVALSCDHSPRTPPFNMNYLTTAYRRLGQRAASEVLWRQSRLMGLLCARLNPKTAQLHSLIVDPSRRGEGIAGALVQSVEQEARRQKQETILLYILDGNPVEDFYHRLGYSRVRVPRSKHPLPHRGIAMQRTLESYSTTQKGGAHGT